MNSSNITREMENNFLTISPGREAGNTNRYATISIPIQDSIDFDTSS